MRDVKETWAFVLAGGEGTRLQQITTTREGVIIPKQYCSLEHSSCLLQDALTRARTIAMPSHVGTVVAAQHRQWWEPVVKDLDQSNVLVQPQNKGTGVGILLTLLHLYERSPQANVVLLPADHYFRNEEPVTRALRTACNLARAQSPCIYLLGADPETPDPELGYIVPMESAVDKPSLIARFTEKPEQREAQELLEHGALWNLFIVAGSVGAMLGLFHARHASVVSRLREALACDAAGSDSDIQDFYRTVEPIDFSHDILEAQASELQVIRVARSGWTDLGTPKRVEATVRTLASVRSPRERHTVSAPLFFDLGAVFMQAANQ